jgi:predicted permease
MAVKSASGSAAETATWALVPPPALGHVSRMQVILAAFVPVLLLVLTGYWIARTQKPFDPKTITFLAATIGTPALVFSNLARSTVSGEALASILAATFVGLCCNLAFGALALRAGGFSLRAFLPSLAFPNNGNLGLPLALFAFGQEGLNYAIAIFSIISIGNHTIGQAIAAGSSHWRRGLFSPIVGAAVAGIVWSFAQLPLPRWFDNTLSLLSGLTIPLLLIMLGTALARIPVTSFPRAGVLSVMRLALGIAVGFGVSSLFGFTGAERGAFVLQCAMPVAVYNYVYAQLYNTAPEEVASLVVLSTVLAGFTIPVLLAVLT